jgi:hypothetical protein
LKFLRPAVAARWMPSRPLEGDLNVGPIDKNARPRFLS